MPDKGMEGTIAEDSLLNIDSKVPVTRGSIVAHHYPNRRTSDPPRVSRVVGMPGDTVQVRRGVVYVNGRIVPAPPKSRLSYTITLSDAGNLSDLASYEMLAPPATNHPRRLSLYLSKQELHQLEDADIAEDVEPLFVPVHQHDPNTYQSTPANGWNRDYYGPVIVPRAGDPGVPEDYFFVLGDNRHNCIDSRTTGPVPQSWVLGVIEEP